MLSENLGSESDSRRNSSFRYKSSDVLSSREMVIYKRFQSVTQARSQNRKEGNNQNEGIRTVRFIETPGKIL